VFEATYERVDPDEEIRWAVAKLQDLAAEAEEEA
jgi:hypothetical protein